MRAVTGWLLVVLVALLFGFVVLQVAVGDISSTCMPWDEPVEAHLSIERADARAGHVNVAGTTDLSDGAVLAYFFLHESDLGDVSSLPRYQAGGDAPVRDGQFSFSADLSAWPDGDAVMDLWFEIGPEAPQPDEVVEVFGASGQCLSGPQVGVDSPGDRKALQTDARVRLPNG